MQRLLWECGKAIWEAGHASEQPGPEHIVSYPSAFPPPCPWIMGRPRLCPRRLMASRGGEINTEDPPWVIRLFNRQHTTRPSLLRSKWHQRNKQFYPSGIPSLQEPPLEINSRLWIVFTQRREKSASYPFKKKNKINKNLVTAIITQ